MIMLTLASVKPVKERASEGLVWISGDGQSQMDELLLEHLTLDNIQKFGDRDKAQLEDVREKFLALSELVHDDRWRERIESFNSKAKHLTSLAIISTFLGAVQMSFIAYSSTTLSGLNRQIVNFFSYGAMSFDTLGALSAFLTSGSIIFKISRARALGSKALNTQFKHQLDVFKRSCNQGNVSKDLELDYNMRRAFTEFGKECDDKYEEARRLAFVFDHHLREVFEAVWVIVAGVGFFFISFIAFIVGTHPGDLAISSIAVIGTTSITLLTRQARRHPGIRRNLKMAIKSVFQSSVKKLGKRPENDPIFAPNRNSAESQSRSLTDALQSLPTRTKGPQDIKHAISEHVAIESTPSVHGELPTYPELQVLDKLSPVDVARYNSSYATTSKRHGCTAGTRQKTLEDLQSWVEDPRAAKVYWLDGAAATGKTTIAYSMCEWLAKSGWLGGNFFCSLDSPACSDANNIVPTLAYQLAQYSPTFRSKLCKVLEANPESSKLDIAWQFTKLLKEPMQAVRATMQEKVTIVVDALDECREPVATQLFLETLLWNVAMVLPIKFLLTSRPEPFIRRWTYDHSLSPHLLRLQDIGESTVEADIRTYLNKALETMRPPPSSNDVEWLAQRAGKLFGFAATAVRYIDPGNHNVNSHTRLKAMLGTGPASNKQHVELDSLYTSIISAARSPDLEEQEKEDVLLVLKTVVCAKETMSEQTLAAFLDLTPAEVSFALTSLQSVLHVSANGNEISPFHSSLGDYLFDPTRSKEFHCDVTDHNRILSKACFDMMKKQLRFNICHLETSYVLDRDVPDLQGHITNQISPALSYACRHWGGHLRQGTYDVEVRDRLAEFLNCRLLFWMEVLNLEHKLALGSEMLRRIQPWLKDSNMEIHKQLVADAEQFMARFAGGACPVSTPHIYISALPFCPKSSSVYQNYWAGIQGLIDAKGSAVEQWLSADLITCKTDSTIRSVSFSPDSMRIVSGARDKTLRVWNATTGEVEAEFRGHTGSVNSVAFSPDGARVVSGSDDRTLRIWNATTGKAEVEFRGHTGSVNSVAFSPDGSCIVSGARDETLRVWNATTGEAEAEFRGHTGSVNSVAFSSDGARVVSGSDDRTLRIWNATTGEAEVEFGSHTGSVNSVAFSPDGTRVVSGSNDRTLRVWDAHSNIATLSQFEGHTSRVNEVSFSPDGTCVVSGSGDHTMRVWDARTGNTIAGPFKGHTHPVSSVAFSPDGTRIVSGSRDKTLRVWDIRTGETIAGPFEGHAESVNTVSFSPDGTCIVSGSDDGTILVWDAVTGEILLRLSGHTGSVISVTFSPDGTRIVSGSREKNLRVWDAGTGEELRVLEGHTDLVSSVAFSPDGALVVSGSYDNTIRGWDAGTGEELRVLEGHTDSVSSVAFSPDGALVVSGSYDNTIRVWNALTGQNLEVFEGHTEGVNSVAFSPDSTLIVSGSDDKTIRVWEARRTTAEGFSGDFVFHDDGWVTGNRGLLFWISPSFRTQLPFPRNTLVIGPKGTTSIDFRAPLCIGEKWSDCYRRS